MQLGYRSLLLGTVCVWVLSGCEFTSPWGSSSNGSDYGATATTGGTTGSGKGGTTGGTTTGGVGGESGTTGSDDSVVATASSNGVVAAVGAVQTISVSFTSSDGRAMTGFGISGTLGTLPAGWSGPSTFTCALVQAGSGCVLNLTYSPTATDSGSIVIHYVYVDNANLAKAPGGTVTIPYEAIVQNNVVATAAPSGQINAVVGAGTQTVAVNFATDTGDAATNLVLNGLGALPAGWSSAPSSLTCAIVSSGNGCQVVLTYAPSAAGRGTVSLNYTYVDGSGAARIATLNIPYATTSSNNVVATASPSGQVEAIEKTGGQAVAVDFTTDDGKPAGNLQLTSSLTALPPGWHSGASSFTCGSIGTGNGCQLRLTYAPTALASGTLFLTYAYTDDAGTAQTGSLDVPYTATTNDNVVATPAPTGQINAVVGMGTQSVSVTFTTDDARPATALALTTSLADLPAGWSSTAGAFACAGLTSGSGCQLRLTYAPTAAAAGTLTLRYGYKNNAGEAKTGSINIPYRATTNDTIAGTPSQVSLAVLTGSSNPVTVVFATDDGNPASALTVTSGLSDLPAGWTSPSGSFTCATVSAGTPCQLALAYSPTVVGNGTVTLGFSYLNDAGFAKTGTVSIAYRANSDDSILGTANPTTVSVAVGTSTTVYVTFTTSDGNLASALAITSDLTALLTGWTSPLTGFTCSSISTGSTCQLALTYTPLLPATGTLVLDYSYTNNAGMPEVGSVSIDYTAE